MRNYEKLDSSELHFGENSPEQVALKLMKIIAKSEGKNAEPSKADVDRKWLLDTYAECLAAVKGMRSH